MTRRDWNLVGASLEALRFAEALLAHEGRPDRFVDEYHPDADQAWAAAKAHGWVETVDPLKKDSCKPGYSPRPYPKLTSDGHLKIEEVQRLRTERRARVNACREALLLWLADEGRGADGADLLVEHGTYLFYGDPFTKDEVDEAGKFLVETGLVKAISVWGPDIVRPVLTADGQQCVDFHDGDVRAFLTRGQKSEPVTYQQVFNAPVGGQVAQGRTINLTQNQGMDAGSLSEAFAAMRQALTSIENDDDREDLGHAIRELEVAVEAGDLEEVEARAGRLKRLGGRIGSTVVTAATAAGTQAILQALGLG